MEISIYDEEATTDDKVESWRCSCWSKRNKVECFFNSRWKNKYHLYYGIGVYMKKINLYVLVGIILLSVMLPLMNIMEAIG